MYQMTFLVTASSSMARWMRPSSWPNHCWPAIRSAPLASNTIHPSRSSRLASRRRNALLPTLGSPDTSSGTGRRLQRGCLRGVEPIPPGGRLDERVEVLLLLPEAAERGEEGAIERGLLQPQQLGDERRRVRVAHALQQALHGGGLGQHRRPRPEHRRIAQPLALGQIVAEHRRQDGIVAPPVLGSGERRADRRAHGGTGEILEREVHGPGIHPVEMAHDLVHALLAVGALLERGDGGAGERPAGPGRVLQHGIDGHRAGLQQLDRLAELALPHQLLGVHGGADRRRVRSPPDGAGARRAARRRLAAARPGPGGESAPLAAPQAAR